jgi:glycosidase
VFIENHDMNRFASEMAGDVRKEKVGAALNILLQGTPLIYYGQELGMQGRQNKTWGTDANDIPVREAFEWTAKVDGPGSANWYHGPSAWWTGRYAKSDDGISVAEEERDSTSLLSFYRRLLTLRRSRPELASGDQHILATDRSAVLAVLRSSPGQASLLLVNLSDSACTVAVRPRPEGFAGNLRDLLMNATEGDSGRFNLPPFGVKLVAP